MAQGIVTTFLEAPKSKDAKPVAVLEVDEANVIEVTKYIKPKAFVFTNIFRDQMDRYGEIYTTYQKILNGVALAPEATIIANGDAPIFHSKELPNPIIYYGFDHEPDSEMKAKPNTDGSCVLSVKTFYTTNPSLTVTLVNTIALFVASHDQN